MRYLRPYSSRPPRSLARERTQLDNIALVPASELESLEWWKAASRTMDPGGVLVVAPSDNVHLQSVGRRIDRIMRQRGRRAHLVILY